jgi:hypothetical protein
MTQPGEKAAFDAGHAEMVEALRAGNVPTSAALGAELESLFRLSKKSETVQAVERDPDSMEVVRTISQTRNRGQAPTQRFFGKITALLDYAAAIRAKGVTLA